MRKEIKKRFMVMRWGDPAVEEPPRGFGFAPRVCAVTGLVTAMTTDCRGPATPIGMSCGTGCLVRVAAGCIAAAPTQTPPCASDLAAVSRSAIRVLAGTAETAGIITMPCRTGCLVCFSAGCPAATLTITMPAPDTIGGGTAGGTTGSAAAIILNGGTRSGATTVITTVITAVTICRAAIFTETVKLMTGVAVVSGTVFAIAKYFAVPDTVATVDTCPNSSSFVEVGLR